MNTKSCANVPGDTCGQARGMLLHPGTSQKSAKMSPQNPPFRHIYSDSNTQQTPTNNASPMRPIINPSDATPKLSSKIEFGDRQCTHGPNIPTPLPNHATTSDETSINSNKNAHKTHEKPQDQFKLNGRAERASSGTITARVEAAVEAAEVPHKPARAVISIIVMYDGILGGEQQIKW